MALNPATRRSWKYALLCTVCGLAAFALRAQMRGKGFSIPDFYPNGRFRTLVAGDEFTRLPNGTVAITGFQLQTYRETGATNAELIAAAPDCAYDIDQKTGSSPGPLRIDSGDGNLHIDGVGYFFRQLGTNLTLDISNRVHTTVRRGYVTAPSAAGGQNTTENSQLITITSDVFHYDRQAGLITYTGHVHAEDDQTDMSADTMTVLRSEDGTIENITGDQNVVLVSKTTGGRATGQHAVYTSSQGRQTVTLTGNPRWQDSADENAGKVLTGTVFTLDRPDALHSTLRADGDAHLRMPRGSLSQSGLMFGSQPAQPGNTPTGTNGFVQINSDTMTFQLPPTNGPVQAVVADGHVLILDPDANTRATATHADYSDLAGYLQLTGNPVWQADQRVARGDVLSFDRESQSFSARTNAFLRFPASALGQSVNASGGPSRSAGSTTNQFVEVTARDYEYRGGLLTFHDDVHAVAKDGDIPRGLLDCGVLRVLTVSNQLQTLEAERDVHARILPVTNADGGTVERDLKCDIVDVTMRTNSLVEEIVANGNVRTLQTETHPGKPLPKHLALDSEALTVNFMETTNAVERILAEKNVVVRQDEITAHGGRAIYTASNDMAEMTDHPVIVSTNGTLVADRLTLDQSRHKFYAWDYTARIKVETNKFTAKVPGAKSPQ
jgi:lipopolysaccharide transport protein LptA